MDIGPEDMVEFCIHYLPGLGCAILASVGILVSIHFGKKLRPKLADYEALRLILVAAPLTFWMIYFVSTAELSFTLVMLGSENSGAAEWAYVNRFKKQVTTVDAALDLAVAKHQWSNVRFYSSCLIADLLVTNNDAAVKTILERLDGAPMVDTEFFGGNHLTDQFYIPGRSQVHLPVREIVERRLRVLRDKSQP